MPGIAPENLEITFENRVLTIRGEWRAENEAQNAKVYRRELASGSFARSLRLPETVDTDAIEASFKNGLVTIRAPHRAEVKPAPIRIAVRTEATEPQAVEAPTDATP